MWVLYHFQYHWCHASTLAVVSRTPSCVFFYKQSKWAQKDSFQNSIKCFKGKEVNMPLIIHSHYLQVFNFVLGIYILKHWMDGWLHVPYISHHFTNKWSNSRNGNQKNYTVHVLISQVNFTHSNFTCQYIMIKLPGSK